MKGTVQVLSEDRVTSPKNTVSYPKQMTGAESPLVTKKHHVPNVALTIITTLRTLFVFENFESSKI